MKGFHCTVYSSIWFQVSSETPGPETQERWFGVTCSYHGHFYKDFKIKFRPRTDTF